MNYEALKSKEDLWDLYSAKDEYPGVNSKTHENTTPKIITSPIVSKGLLEKQTIPDYPNGGKFAICLGHDVDEIYFPLSHFAQSALHNIKHINPKGVWDSIVWKIDKTKSPYLKFTKILDLEKTYDVKSSFYFLATEKDILRFRYKLEDAAEIIKQIEDEGFEIGLHGGYYAYNDQQEILAEKTRLEKLTKGKIIGYRNHYLKFDVPTTWHLLKKAGFSYDATLGYNTGNGFRNGMCHPYKPYDRNNEKFIDLIEIPLIVMDSAFQKGPTEVHWKEVERLINEVERNQGVLTVNFHNDVFHSSYKSGFMKIYEKLLTEGKRRNAWITNGAEIFNWWNTNCIK
jgi:peptidoglycan/xylan/chitin deacetylase (PgdA/CDA1 family)